MEPCTHLTIDPRLCGTPVSLAQGAATVTLRVLPEMAVDARGLTHGGFVFGLADYAAMLAINEPNVVLGSADVRLLAPVVTGDLLCAEARHARSEGRKWIVEVTVHREAEASARERLRVLTGTFTCFVPNTHVLAAGEQAQGKAAP